MTAQRTPSQRRHGDPARGGIDELARRARCGRRSMHGRVAICVVALFPILWGLSTSLKPRQGDPRVPAADCCRRAPTLEHYPLLFATGIHKYILNSAIVSAVDRRAVRAAGGARRLRAGALRVSRQGARAVRDRRRDEHSAAVADGADLHVPRPARPHQHARSGSCCSTPPTSCRSPSGCSTATSRPFRSSSSTRR